MKIGMVDALGRGALTTANLVCNNQFDIFSSLTTFLTSLVLFNVSSTLFYLLRVCSSRHIHVAAEICDPSSPSSPPILQSSGALQFPSSALQAS